MESQVSSMRRPCFRAEDDGLASIAGFSGNNNNNNNNNNNSINHGYPLNHQNQAFLCYNGGGGAGIMMRRRNSLRNIHSLSPTSSPSSSVFSPRSARLLDSSTRFDELHSPHFLESCSLCKKPLGGNRDIFMYRGDTPFCSEDCRQEQIDIDETKEKKRNLKVLRSKKDSTKSGSSTSSTSSPSKNQNYPFRTGTVAAA